LLLSAALITSCGHTPVTRTLFDAFGSGHSVSSISLNPSFTYLRVVVHGNEALMVLGYVEESKNGPLQTWYSSNGETIQTRSGRVVSTRGLPVDWVQVRYNGLHSWENLINSNGIEFVRLRDQMPGYKFGVEERIELSPIQPPKDAHLHGISPSSLTWFEERVQGQAVASARFGLKVDQQAAIVVYGEQCLSADLCIAWQSWPTKP
jgi:hypothetical protein